MESRESKHKEEEYYGLMSTPDNIKPEETKQIGQGLLHLLAFTFSIETNRKYRNQYTTYIVAFSLYNVILPNIPRPWTIFKSPKEMDYKLSA